MTTATDTAPHITETAVPSIKTRKVDVEIHSAESLAELTGLPVFMVRGATPPHATRIGHEYLVLAEHAERLRAVRTGTPVGVAYRRENEIDAKRNAEIQKPIDDVIRAADARCAAEREARKEAARAETAAYLAREKRRVGADYVDAKGVTRNALGERIV